MKLLKGQYQDILKTFQDQGIGPDHFTLTKKKGRIKIQYSGSESFFEFFRRKSVELSDDSHQWKHHEHYEVNISGQSSTVANWHEVIARCARWLMETRS